MAEPITPDYGTQFLFPPSLEELLPADHPARFLREFVDQLDLPQLGFSMPQALEGRPPYAPSLLLKIWLYGYYHRIRSTRKLETACQELLPLMWLCGMLKPDHNSLWRFWRDNKKALRQVFKMSVELAVRTGAVGLALQAVDGTKIQAVASNETGWSRERMEKLLAALDQSLAETELKVVEENRSTPANGLKLPEGLAQRQALREEVKKGLAQLDIDGRRCYHRHEPEARVMKVRNTHRFAHNAQTVVDGQEGVIVACEVTRQETDHGALVPMIEQARENVGLETRCPVTLADTGYGSGGDLKAAVDNGHEVLAPPLDGKSPKNNPYATLHFKWDAVQRKVTCPRGQELRFEGYHDLHEGTLKAVIHRIARYRCACKDCPVKSQCTKDPKGRKVEVREHTQVVQEIRARLETREGRELYERRGALVEPVFAWIKQHQEFRRWTVRGLENVKTQWSMVCTSMNLRLLYRRWKGGRGWTGRGPVAAVQSAVQGVAQKGYGLIRRLKGGLRTTLRRKTAATFWTSTRFSKLTTSPGALSWGGYPAPSPFN